MLVNYKEAGLYHVGGFMFRPGVNDVPEKEWKVIGEHPHVKARIKAGSLAIVTAPVKNAKGESTEKGAMSLDDFDTAKAVEVVADTLNHELLVSWIKKEERLPVKTAIEAQLRKLDLDAEGKPLSKGKDKE